MVRNMGWILSSQVAISLLGMIALAFGARALGAAGLGALAVVEAYSRIVARLTHLEPWQAVIRHGSDALESEQTDRFGRLIGLSTQIDIFGGLLAAAVAIVLAPVVGPRLGFDGAEVWLLVAGGAAALVSMRPTGLSLLRLHDRFDLLARLDAGAALLRAGLSALAWLMGAGLAGFVAIFVAVSVGDGILAFVFGLREARRRGHRAAFADPRRVVAEFPGFLRLMWNSNLAVMLRQTSQRFDVMILAALVSPASVGFYHLARRLAEAGLRIGRPVSQAIYPELARMAARSEHGRFGRVVAGAGGSMLVILALGLGPVLWQLGPIIRGFFGDAFLPAIPVVQIQIAAVAVYLAGIVLNPALLSLGMDRGLVRVGFLTATLFFVLIVPLVHGFGVVGASMTHLLCNLVWLVCCAALLWRGLRMRQAPVNMPATSSSPPAIDT